MNVAFDMPDGMEFVNASGASGVLHGSAPKVTFHAVEILAPRSVNTWRLTLRATKAGELNVRSRVTASGIAEQVKRQRIDAYQ